LAEIGRRVSPGAHAVLVLDGAGWHSSPRLRVPANISLLPLPRVPSRMWWEKWRRSLRLVPQAMTGVGAPGETTPWMRVARR
jgi:hypothetical protein